MKFDLKYQNQEFFNILKWSLCQPKNPTDWDFEFFKIFFDYT